MLTQKEKMFLFASITLICLILYRLFLSVQWDLNGIIEAQSVDAGGKDMFSPNHLLYRPLSFIIFKFWQSTGYPGDSAKILQYITTVSGAAGIGFFFLALYHVTDHAVISMVGAAFLATSWSYWKFSVDVSYIIPAAMFVSASLALLLRKEQSGWSFAVTGVISGLSILFWQANVFLVPWIVMTILWLHWTKSFRAHVTMVIQFLAPVGIVVGLAYILLPILLFEHYGLADAIGWAISHGADMVGRSPMWGRWDADRLLPAATNAIASFIPLWQGLGVRKLLQGTLQSDKILPQLSLLALLVLSGWTLFLLFRQQLRNTSHAVGEIIWLILAYMSFLPFIIWWEPYETRWFIIPNIFLITAMSKIWSRERKLRSLVVMGGCITIIGVANFTSTIWPYHSSPNPWMQLAQCFARQTTKADTFIPTDWNWFSYAVYFFDYQGQVLDLKRGDQYRAQNIESIEKELASKRRGEGNVYIIDVNSYSRQTLEYFTEQVGMSLEILNQFEQSPSFICGELQFMRIRQRKR